MKTIDWKPILIGSLLGAGFGWGVSHYYYVESGKDLEMEAAKLRRLNTIMLTGMENAGWVKLNRDQAGEITGLIIDLSGGGRGEASGGATLNVQPSATTPDPANGGR